MNILIIAIVIIILGMIVENIRELHGFRTTVYNIASPKLAGLQEEKRIVFLSDLHNYSYGEENGRLFQAIISARPDLILIGGDMLVRKDGNSYEDTLRFLCRLPSICKVFYANGNHEQKMKECEETYGEAYRKYRKRLADSGIHMLENEADTIWIRGQRMQIGGLEIPVSFFTKQFPWKHHETYREESPEKQMPGQFDLRPVSEGGPYKILLAHQALYAETYAGWGMDLVLCGHLHGGVVRLPGIGGVISPQLTLFPKYSGEHSRFRDCDIIVSKGLGGHSIPIRLFNRAEVIVIRQKS